LKKKKKKIWKSWKNHVIELIIYLEQGVV